ncbi:IS30 family transposase [Patescibacteria group bacterium]
MSHKHITPEQQNELSVLIRAGVLQKDIAEILGKTPSAISQEISRNGENGKYHAGKAKEKTKERRIKANQRFRKIKNNEWLRKYIIRKLFLYWSPEQISGRLKIDYPDDKSKWIGKDSIYNFIYSERKDLVKYLRCQKGNYRRRYGTRIREKEREKLKKKRIDTRPTIADERGRIGDWEGDTIVGKDKSHILTHVDRKSGLLIADKLIRGTAELTREKVVDRFGRLPKDKRKTITYDNGSTFACYELIERNLDLDVYFAYPYRSWERGCNENCNGLIRQFFPKGIKFGNIQDEEIKKVEKLINERPRKRLGYLTPKEVFFEKRFLNS